jgi:hypothetical protein
MFANMNLLATFVAAIAAWLAGAVYYGVLCNQWIAALGKTPEQADAERKANAGTVHAWLPFVLSFLADLAMAWILAGLIAHLGAFTLRGGIVCGAFVWAGFVLTTVLVNNAFAGRRYMLTVIDTVHWLIALIIIGAVIGAWGL